MQQYADIYLLESYSTCWREVAVQVVNPCTLQYDLYRRLRVQFLILLLMGAVTPETYRVALQ